MTLYNSINSKKDCVVVASPSRTAVVTTGTTAAVTTCNNDMLSPLSYTDNNFLKVFDKYNDKFIKTPQTHQPWSDGLRI